MSVDAFCAIFIWAKHPDLQVAQYKISNGFNLNICSQKIFILTRVYHIQGVIFVIFRVQTKEGFQNRNRNILFNIPVPVNPEREFQKLVPKPS